jgi:hypothetical protein
MIGFVVLLAMSAAFKKSTGVAMPTNRALRGIRRRAKKAGVHFGPGYAAYIARKQKKLRPPK